MLGRLIASISSIASTALSIANSVSLIVSAIEVVTSVIMSVCKELGLIENQNIESEQLGEKALAAEQVGIVPEKFERYEDYVKDIEKFEADKMKLNDWTKEEKEQRGMELTIGLLLEKFGSVVVEVINEVAKRPEFFNTERTQLYLEKASSNEIDMKEVTSYLDGQTKGLEKMNLINDKMVNIEKIINPELTPNEVQRIINLQKTTV
ncbi:hypothetical protein [Bacillus anthracis]|uniref:hypothetical protein n=1 Tax=Bacillus anthracis TaxID=1392 RepID=UPI002DC00E85|nr:hypothetical protein [Bacillus anthracis]MEB9458425.1 hypothetical protein [Bacillus anthracis]